MIWVYFVVSTLIFGWFVLGPYGQLFGSIKCSVEFILAIGCIWCTSIQMHMA